MLYPPTFVPGPSAGAFFFIPARANETGPFAKASRTERRSSEPTRSLTGGIGTGSSPTVGQVPHRDNFSPQWAVGLRNPKGQRTTGIPTGLPGPFPGRPQSKYVLRELSRAAQRVHESRGFTYFLFTRTLTYSNLHSASACGKIILRQGYERILQDESTESRQKPG